MPAGIPGPLLSIATSGHTDTAQDAADRPVCHTLADSLARQWILTHEHWFESLDNNLWVVAKWVQC